MGTEPTVILKLTRDELRDLISLLMKTGKYPVLLARLMTLVEPMKGKDVRKADGL